MVKKLKPVEIIALKNAVNGDYKAARAKVKPGQYPVEFTVTVKGTLKVGEDHLRADSLADPWLIMYLMSIKLTKEDIEACITYANKTDMDVEEFKKYIKERSKFKRVDVSGKVDSNLFVNG